MTQKEKTLHNAREFYKVRKMSLIAFENNVFPLPKQYPSENIGDWKEDKMDSIRIISEETDELLPSVNRRKRKTEKERELKNIVKSKYDTFNDLDELLYKTREYLDSDLIKKHFDCSTLKEMLENLFDTRGTYKNGVRVSLIKYGLRDLRNEIGQISENEIRNKRPDVIVNLVEKILDVDELQLDRFYVPKESPRNIMSGLESPRNIMSGLESEESAAQRRNHRGQGLKMLTILPISFAQLKTENNSEKLKNEIRQLLYSLHRSKKLAKTIYKHLMNAI